jgi:hypothetical protein
LETDDLIFRSRLIDADFLMLQVIYKMIMY